MQFGNHPWMETHPQDLRKFDPSSFEKSGQHLKSQKGVNKYSNKPKGMMMAVFWTSSGSTGNWW
jgi:hypothetical protein